MNDRTNSNANNNIWSQFHGETKRFTPPLEPQVFCKARFDYAVICLHATSKRQNIFADVLLYIYLAE